MDNYRKEIDAEKARDAWLEKCPSCAPEDHEISPPWACRCEDRNIKVAKIRREKDERK
jgi:hypothetical protein